MKFFILNLLIIAFVRLSTAQQQVNELEAINDQVMMIDSDNSWIEIFLEPEIFLSKMADHDAELKGYYQHDRLKKIIRHYGIPAAMITTQYYFWNEQLIYIQYTQKKYIQTRSENGAILIDYSNSFTEFESKHYFHNAKEIDAKITGTPVSGATPDTNFIKYAKKIKGILDNKYEYRTTYEALQGKWIDMESEGNSILYKNTILFTFRDGKFYKKQYIKIEKDVIYCSSPKDNYINKYSIKSLTDQELVLQDLQNQSMQELFIYQKKE